MIRCALFTAALVAFAASSVFSAEPSSQPAGASDWSDKDFVHPPLKCMALYKRIDEFPVLAWCFHGRGAPGYNEEYVKLAEECGFNVLIDGEIMLKPCEKFEGIKVMVVAFRYAPERIQKQIFDRFGDHPRLIGFVLDDNCPRIYGWSIKASNWLRQNYPHVVPWISENPDPRAQSRTAMRVLGTQNYWMTRAGGGWGRQAFCFNLERDRRNGNERNMSFWPLFSAPASMAAVRFQANAAVAHGAQGICYFAFGPGTRWPQWVPPNGSVAKAAAYANSYIRQVAGRYTWGTRCMAVLHSASDGDVPRASGRAGPGQIIEHMDPALLAGLLLPEKKFDEKVPEGQKKIPLYAMVVDKRTDAGNQDRPRTARVSFGPDVEFVEVLARRTGTDKDKIRRIEPAWSVPLELITGDGVLLRLNPDGIDKLFGPGAGSYKEIVRSIGNLRRKVLDGKAGIAEFDRTVAAAGKKLQALSDATDDMEANGEPPAVRQRRDMLKRLAEQLDELQTEALQPRILTEAGFFAGTAYVEIASRVKGSEIHYTLDGGEPTLSARRYTAPVAISSSAKVRARGAGGSPRKLVGEEVSAEFKQVKGKITATIRVNFQPKGVEAPAGALADRGEKIKTHASGWTYGWSRDMTKSVGRRGVNEDILKDTVVHWARHTKWEFVLEAGSYEVTVVLGDAKFPTANGLIIAEDKALCSGLKLKPGEFKTFTAAVTVSDGRLTVFSHDLGARYQSRVNYVEIRRK